MLGLHPLDWVVVGAYVALVVALGWRARRGVRSSGDYFMGGRRFGRVVMIAQAFGQGTRTDQAVAVIGASAQNGLAGLWVQWLYLFSTPFFWLLAPVYRRSRYLTIGDFFERRYGPGMGAAFALVGLLFFAVNIGVGLKATGVTFEAATGGAIGAEVAIFGMLGFFLLYSLLGGLVAGGATSTVQGVMILVLSFLPIPFALARLGGLDGLRAALPDDRPWFNLFSGGADITLFYVVMATVNALVGVVVQPHHMAINGSGKDEISTRSGWTYGTFVKRGATLGWAFTGLCVAALFPALLVASAGGREAAFGQAVRALLPPGFAGLMAAAIIASVVAAASGFMTNGAALFTRNFYVRWLRPGAPDAEVLRVARVSAAVIGLVGVGAALYLPSVLKGLEFLWKITAFLGIAFWAALFWKRANRVGAWASLAVTVAAYLWASGQGWSFPAQAALYLPLGVVAMVAGSLLTRREPDSVLNPFYSLLNTPVGEEARLVEAGVPMVHAGTPQTGGPQTASPPAGDLQTGTADVAPGAIPIQPRVVEPGAAPPLLDDEPARQRGARLLLVNLLTLGRDFRARDFRDDLTGFGISWALVAGFLLLGLGLAALLGA